MERNQEKKLVRPSEAIFLSCQTTSEVSLVTLPSRIPFILFLAGEVNKSQQNSQ